MIRRETKKPLSSNDFLDLFNLSSICGLYVLFFSAAASPASRIAHDRIKDRNRYKKDPCRMPYIKGKAEA